MNIEAISSVISSARPSLEASEKIETKRKSHDAQTPEAVEKGQMQSEELLQEIKGLTEDGIYSVRFENDQESKKLVVKVVDNKSDEVIRQIPAEELLNLTKKLEGLRGNLVNTEG